MLLPSSLVLITGALTALSAAVAIPEPDKNLHRRTCTTIQPASIDVLSSSSPNTPSLGTQFILSRENGVDNIISTITFNVPTGSTGCMINILIPELTVANEIASGTATQADVWTVQPWTTSSPPTFNNPPVKNQFVSTTIFPTDTTTSSYSTVLESNSCSPVMSFLFQLSTWQQGSGFVDFTNSPSIGFSLTFDC